jgi:energy-converting hydrogenase Eha subunit F
VAKPTIVATGHHEEHPSGYSSPTTILDKLLRHPRNLVTIEHFSSPILFATGIHFPLVLLHNQGYSKVCPDPLNLSKAGNPFAGISSLSSCSLFSPTGDLIALI